MHSRTPHRTSRRRFLTALAAVPAIAVAPRVLLASGGSRALRLVNTHTGESLSAEYFTTGAYVPDALTAIDRVLRDFRTGDVHPIDPELLDLLHEVTTRTESTRPFQIISGYRSPATNEMLRSKSEGVAAGSLHMVGQAVDIRLADVPLTKLKTTALAIRRGGVGYYPASDFVHVDTGRVRTW